MEAKTQPREAHTNRRRGGSRKKTGCSTCKARHVRCDEKKPVCSTCERLGLECRPGEIIAYSEWCPPKKDKPRRRGSVAIANNDVSSQGPPTSTWDIFSSNLPELNCNSTSGSSEPSPESLNLLPLSPTTGVGTASPPTTPAVVLTAETVYLLREFQNGLAKWMDVFDHESTYQREVCRRALTFQLLLTCICAFTARQLCLIGSGETWTPVATKYYSQSLNLLIKQINNPDRRDDILTAVMLLSSYEILAAEGEEYRQHCEGAMKLIRTHGINAQSTGLDRASFWIWTRHELTVAIANEMPLQMAPKHWNVKWREGETGEDMLGNQILWLVGRAVDWVYGNGTPSEYSDLLRDTERWYAALPPSFCGVKYGEPIEDELSKVHFAVPAAVAASLWYHLLYILLYAEPALQVAKNASKVQEHATAVINISISEIPDQARCFSITPLYLAGKHINGIVLKTRVWTLLDNIQTELGYYTRNKVEALQRRLEPTSRK